MEIKKLAKNTAILASPKVLTFFVGIIKSKLIAVLLGSSGFGIIDQLTSSINFIRQSTLSFMPDGMVKLIAKERAGDFNKLAIAKIIKTFAIMVLPVLVLVMALSYIFIDELTLFVLGDLRYKKYLAITLVALPITFLSVSWGFLLKAFKEIKAIALRQIIVLVLNFSFFVPLVYYFGIEGGVFSVTLAFFITLVVNIYLVNKFVLIKHEISLSSIKKAAFDIPYFKELLAFIGVGIVSGIFRVVENMTSRSIVVNELGVDKIGIYAPITKWQALFIGFILPAIFTYLYPRLSEAKDNKEVVSVVNDVIRFITYLTLPFIVVGITTRSIIIPIFYSEEFIEAAVYLPYHFSFLLLSVWATIFEQIFASRSRLKPLMFFTIIINSISLFLVYYFVPKIGLYGYMLRFTVTPLILFVSYFVYWRKDILFKLKGENLKLMIYVFGSVGTLLIVKEQPVLLQIALGTGIILMMIFLLKDQERKFLIKKLNTFLRIKK